MKATKLLRDGASWLAPLIVGGAIAQPVGGVESGLWSYLSLRLVSIGAGAVIALALAIVSLGLARTFGGLNVPGIDLVATPPLYALRMIPYWIREARAAGMPGSGRGNRHFESEAAFIKDDRKRSEPDQWDYGMHWSDSKGVRGFRLTWIEKTGELVVVAAGKGRPRDGAVEILAKLDHYHAERALEDWGYVCGTRNSLRWARRRAAGWFVPLPPAAAKSKRLDSQPLKPWPSPPAPSLGTDAGTYIGARGDHSDRVEVSDTKGRRPLYHYVETSPTGMTWGYSGAGPTDLARSILADRLGYVPQHSVYYAFRDAVVARLSDEFVLTFRQVDDWIDANTALFAENPRAVPFDPYAAGGADR